jgi:hypothetical protein
VGDARLIQITQQLRILVEIEAIIWVMNSRSANKRKKVSNSVFYNKCMGRIFCGAQR